MKKNKKTKDSIVPNDKLIKLISKRINGYNKLSPEIRDMIMSGKPIALDNLNDTSIINKKYLEISNKTKSCIVINSLKLVLKPKGESGDAVIIEESKTMDNDIVGLHSASLIEISPPKTRKINKQRDNDNVFANEKEKKSINNKNGSKVVYVDRGQVKKGRMSRSIQDLHMIDVNGDDKKDEEQDIPFIDPS
jgi:hypothetical protein